MGENIQLPYTASKISPLSIPAYISLSIRFARENEIVTIPSGL